MGLNSFCFVLDTRKCSILLQSEYKGLTLVHVKTKKITPNLEISQKVVNVMGYPGGSVVNNFTLRTLACWYS